MNSTTAVLELDPLFDPHFDPHHDSGDGAPGAPKPTPHLRPLTRPTRKRKGLSPLLAATTAVGIVISIFVAQLGLSIAVSQGAYETRALEQEQRELSRVERVLAQNVEKLSSPQNLADNAMQLGMVQNATPATLRLSDGAVLGSLSGRTSAVEQNLVPNATLENLPMVDADGLLVDRGASNTEADAAVSALTPVPWEGRLPAPETH